MKALDTVATIASFKEDMAKWDTQRRTHESQTEEIVKLCQQQLEGFQYSLEQKESVLHQLHRGVDRVALELNRIMDTDDDSRGSLQNCFDELSRKVNVASAENEVRIAGLELKIASLNDELWGEETGLARVAGELKKTFASFEMLESSVDELKRGKAEAAQLDKLRAEVVRMVREATSSVASMRQTVGNVVNDVREHFRTASQTISAHNATFVAEVRQQYQGELEKAGNLRREVVDFMQQVEKTVQDQDARVAETAAKASALAAEAREEVEELNRRRKRDKTSSDNELKALKKRLGGVFDNSDMVLKGLEHLSEVLHMVLDSEFMAAALEMQDAIDKKRIALMGVKDDEKTLARSYQTEPQRPRPECRAASAPGGPRPGRGAAIASNAQEPVVRVDGRCLSCSGQAPLVLSAFKMACLQYAPSPVDFEGVQHDRAELLQRRHNLLAKCRQAIQAGPDGSLQTFAGQTKSPSDTASNVGDGIGNGTALSEYASFDNISSGASLRLPKFPQEVSRPLTVR
mmetsp:Transcript_113847/g.179177  ORF Transcript_113847/g.179177 Transcript_113847/m.179177 type:complete len:518 (-) Transcript_113847:214-1767(-)